MRSNASRHIGAGQKTRCSHLVSRRAHSICKQQPMHIRQGHLRRLCLWEETDIKESIHIESVQDST